MMSHSTPIFGLICAAALSGRAAVAWGNPPEEIEEKIVIVKLAEPQLVRKAPANPFETQIFNGVDPDVAREGMERRLKVRLAEIDKLCDLSPDQMQKLKLAGLLDINRLFECIERHRRKFEAEQLNPAPRAARLNELAPLQVGLFLSSNGIFFRERSLVHKTALTTLQPDQLEKYRQELEQRRLATLNKVQKAMLKMLGAIDENQRRELLELWGELPCAQSGPVDALVFLHQASHIPDVEYRKILDARAWQVLQERLTGPRNYGPMLRELGFIHADASLPEMSR